MRWLVTPSLRLLGSRVICLDAQENMGQSRLFHRRVLHHGAMQLLSANAKMAMKPNAQVSDLMFRGN